MLVAVLAIRKERYVEQQDNYAPMKRMCGLFESSVGELLMLAIMNVSTMARYTLNIGVCEFLLPEYAQRGCARRHDGRARLALARPAAP